MAKGEKKNRPNQEYAPAISDDRFSRLQTDPRFLRPNREESKVIVDDRFKGLLSGGLSGNKKGRVDRYGRKIKSTTNGKDDGEMKRLYRLENEEGREASGSSSSGSASASEEEDQQGGRAFVDYARGEGQLESSEEDSSSEEEDDESESESDSQGITIGTSAARRKEKQRLRFAQDDESDEDEEEEEERGGADISAAARELQVAEGDLAELDARAERTVRREAAAAKKAAQAAPKRSGDTNRLAIVNMDWDHIRAIDLYKVFSSLVSPAGRAPPTIDSSSKGDSNLNGEVERKGDIAPVRGRVLNVRVYPSNFGLERMAKENQEGPPREIFKRDEDGKSRKKKKSKKSKRQNDDDSEESEMELFEVDEGGEFDEEALRNYQLERLRYYYAIVTFDTPEAARHIINEIDGTEMERTANVFDLSFVPKEMTIPEKKSSKEDLTDEGWRDEATEVTDGAGYKGVDFTTDALRHSKVKLTWDADDPQRSKITRQLAQEPLSVDALRDEDFKAYLASDSEHSDDEEDEEEGEDNVRTKMRSLLGLNGGSEADSTRTQFGKSKSKAFEDGRKSRQGEEGGEGGRDMQITFMPGLSEATQRKKKGLVAEEQEETTLEKYMRKQREKKERKRGGNKAEEETPTIESNGKSLTFDDPFFASDNEVDFEEALTAEHSGKGQKEKSKKASTVVDRNEVEPQDIISREELALMVDSDSEGDDAAGHFSMKDILKAEQEGKGKKSRWAKKKEKKSKGKEDGRENEVQENFAINVQDERFQGVFDDHRFALDPSHPSFLKTKNMEKIMDERRKRDKKKRKEPNQVESKVLPVKESASDLADLVKSVKKRSSNSRQEHPAKKKVHRS